MAGPDDIPGAGTDAPGGDPTNRRTAIIAAAVALVAIAAIAVFVLTRPSPDEVTTGGAGGTGGAGTTTPDATDPTTTTAPAPTTTVPGATTTAPTGATTTAPGPDPTACATEAPVPPPAPEPTEALRDSLRAALVGCTEADVETRAGAAGWAVRVVRRDGEDLAVTMDYRPDRLNLTVQDGTVTDLDIG